MATYTFPGYAGKILRVNLTTEEVWEEKLDEEVAKKWLGGAGLGAKYLYEEVPPGVEWSDPENRLMFFAGPLSGTRVAGTGIYSVVTKGAMTDLAAISQANGFFGAFLRFSGYDGVIIQGKSKNWVYLYIHDGTAELRKAAHLLGKDTWEAEDAIKQQLGVQCSVHGIGPAGENLIRFASIVGDRGHVAAHNGLGAVMGSKKLKSIVAARGKHKVAVKDRTRLKNVAAELLENSKKYTMGSGEFFIKWGTAAFYSSMHEQGILPVKNYTTNIFPEHENFGGQYLRTHFETKPSPCWACRMDHCHIMKVTEGPYAGYVGEEPEYEGISAMSCVTGQLDPGATVMLANLADRLGFDVNESGWLLGWLMECYEKGLLTRDDFDGVEMNWGDVDSMVVMMHRIAHRQGFGNLLAEGVKRASDHIGGEAAKCAVYTLKGASPRGHDHRAWWNEMMDTCFSNTGTIEGAPLSAKPQQLGLTPVQDPFDPIAVSTMNAKVNGRRQFEDSLVVCGFCANDLQLAIDTLNAVTGWNLTISDALTIGKRIVNQLRVFNLRHGLTKEMEAPSLRYGSAPLDGPNKGISVAPHWDFIQRNYYQQMGWDTETGRPLPETLEKLGLEHMG
ncbi:aldehyde ferredoxin oxidoreductase family protein [Chloroflexota bacterium]